MLKKILLVEDDLDTCSILKSALSRAGFEVETFHEGKAIVEQQFMLPDVFILDNTMPTIDGIALCKYLRLQANTKNIPIVIISGNHLLEMKAVNAGANCFLPKPLTSESVVSALHQVLNQQEVQLSSSLLIPH